MDSNPVQTLIFFRPYFLAQLSSVNYRENRFHIHLTLINATGTKKKLWSVELLPKQRKYTQKLNDRCWRPKYNDCPKWNEVLNVITLIPKCNRQLALNLIRLQCNRLTPPMHCCCNGRESNSCCNKQSSHQYSCHIAGSLISISVFLFARLTSRSIGCKPRRYTN